MNELNKKAKIQWIIDLRAYACILIILIHIIDGWLEYTNTQLVQFSARWWLDNIFIQLITRVAVPIFIMITGALLLNPQKDITLKKIKKWC